MVLPPFFVNQFWTERKKREGLGRLQSAVRPGRTPNFFSASEHPRTWPRSLFDLLASTPSQSNMLRSAARAVPRSIYRSPTAARLRHASTDTAQRRFAVYQSQTTNPVVYASLGLAALFGWTAAILMVGGQGEKKHAATHAIKEGERSTSDPFLPHTLGNRKFDTCMRARHVVVESAIASTGSCQRHGDESRGPRMRMLTVLLRLFRCLRTAVTSAADATATAVTSVTSADASKKDDRKAAAPEAPSSEAAASSQAAAFNPETGEINWDCPCLGGMADGPCGEEFKAAFSCFVYSEAEPKGIDCVERFRDMQTCFRKHPDIYGDGGCLSDSRYRYPWADESIHNNRRDGR